MLPQDWMVQPDRAGGSLDDPVRDADVENLHVTTQRPARHQYMSGLARHERHRVIGSEGCAEHRAAPSAETGRQVDGAKRYTRILHSGERLPNVFGHGAGKAGTEDGVDDRVSCAGLDALERFGPDGAKIEGAPGVA